MMGIWGVLIPSWGALAVIMFLAWIWQLRTNIANAVDALWALGFTLVAGAAVWSGIPGAHGPRIWLVFGMVAVWSLRLSFHLFRDRVWKVDREDARYASLRAMIGQKGFFFMYQAQALLVVLFGIAILTAAATDRPKLGALDFVAVALWLVAVLGESIADGQLRAFKANPANRGRTCAVGLWRYSRHPNYFFEWMQWWAYVIIGISGRQGVLTLLGPALMFLFLRYLTGVRPSELASLKSRPDYAEYQRRTNMFFPWVPKG